MAMKKNITYFPPKISLSELPELRPVFCTSYNDIVSMNDQLEDDALDW